MPSRSARPRLQEVAPQVPQRRQPSTDELQRWIAEAAYYRAEQRGFQPGGEADDWLAAEAEIQKRVRAGNGVI